MQQEEEADFLCSLLRRVNVERYYHFPDGNGLNALSGSSNLYANYPPI